VADVLGEHVPQALGVRGGQVDHVLDPVDGEGHGLVGLPTVKVVDQLENRSLRHKFLRVDKN
jgi:hypothetical protein